MINRNTTLLILLAVTLFPACRTVVDWELPESEPALVVEGNISTELKAWTVKLTTTQDYFADDAPPVVDDALVYISDDQGNTDTLTYTDGIYTTGTAKQCQPGRTYTLEVKALGKSFKASEYCREQLPIDTLFYFYFPEKNGFIEPGYYVFELAKEIPPKGDYYWWQIIKNDTLQDQFGYITDSDEFANFSFFNQNYSNDSIGNIDPDFPPRPFPLNFKSGDVVTIEQYCINRQLYDFLNQTQIQQNKAGSPFDAPPANPITNVSNGAWGYFGVLNKVSRTVTIP